MLTGKQNRQRVLVVDDEPLVVVLLERALNSFVDVLTAENGSQALEVARKKPAPDLILLDVGLPDMDGHEVCKKLKEDPHTNDVPIIFTTARDMTEDQTAGFESGAADYITKPLNIPITLARVKVHLESRRLNNEIQVQNQRLDDLVRQRTRALEQEMNHRHEVEKRFMYQACHDSLTGLPNMSLLRRTLSTRASSSSAPFALALIVLSGFQEINNTLGHQHGNQLLVQLSSRLKERSRLIRNAIKIEEDNANHSLARVDGVTFAIILDCSLGENEARKEVTSLIQTLDDPVEYLGMSLNFSGYAGLAITQQHGSDVDNLLRRAHIAYEQAMNSDQRVSSYSEDMDPYNERRLSLMGELRSAIQKSTLSLVFQPQKDLRTGEITKVEALLRWQHPQLGFVPPDEFIPLAEQTGVIKPLTAWVLHHAIIHCHELEKKGCKVSVSINLSARNLREADLLDCVLKRLDQYSLEPNRLILEVTETAMMENPHGALATLKALDDAGISISIDDFGTGYSSLGYLRNLPVREVKVDRSFVMDMMENHADRIMVKTIIDMARNLNLRVVAEGVENAETLTTLTEMGCDSAQGYHLCRPISADDLVDWLGSEPQVHGASNV